MQRSGTKEEMDTRFIDTMSSAEFKDAIRIAAKTNELLSGSRKGEKLNDTNRND